MKRTHLRAIIIRGDGAGGPAGGPKTAGAGVGTGGGPATVRGDNYADTGREFQEFLIEMAASL